jgi:ribonuclease HII
LSNLKKYLEPNRLEAGCDEAGRGCLAGPVFAAGAILDGRTDIWGFNDSKKLSEKKRQALSELIKSSALAYSISVVDQHKIDEMNILNASIHAMHLAVSQLTIKPDWLLIDGNRFHPYPTIQHTCIVKGDEKYQSIAAASILAKTFRDEIMLSLHNDFPVYNWRKNKGYPTEEHRIAIQNHGISPHHRKTFRLLPNEVQMKLF